jgi:hypothetical protein
MLAEKLRKIYELVGELSTHVANIDLGWYLLFTCLMPQSPRQLVDAIINVHRTGEGQRQTVMAVVATLYPDDSEIRAWLSKLKAQTDNVVSRRNAAVHSVIDIAHFIIPPRIVAAGTSKPSKLRDKDIELELADCIKTAKHLAQAIQVFIDSLDTTGQPSPALKCPKLKVGSTLPLLD